MAKTVREFLNFGSINIDHVYEVDSFVKAGETKAVRNYQKFLGGKGLNQSVALANAGAKVYHAGMIHRSDGWLLDAIERFEINTRFIHTCETDTGHAMIQVDAQGENAICVYGGANRTFSPKLVEAVLEPFDAATVVMLQNETNCIEEMIRGAYKKGCKVFFNPAPYDISVKTLPLRCIDLLVLNESEAYGLTGEVEPENIQKTLRSLHPDGKFILTAGVKGSYYFEKDDMHYQEAYRVNVLDTTGAGDTFCGFFAVLYYQGAGVEFAMERAAKAAALCVSKKGALNTIPTIGEL